MLLVSLALAAAPPPPIVNGQNASTGQFPAVVALEACWGSCFSYCSGTLVHERWVVTAAHCVDAYKSYKNSGYEMVVGVGERVGQMDDWDDCKAAYSHPSYNSWSLAHDIGLIELVNGITSVDPYPVNTESIDNSWKGEDLTYVGFGVTSDNANDGGIKRFAKIPVHSFDSAFVYGVDTADDQNICYGDSGGAALEDLGGGIYELVGANSHVYSWQSYGTMCVGGGNGAARVDSHLDWILGYVDVGGYEPPAEEPEDEGSGDGGGGGGDLGDGGGGGDGSGEADDGVLRAASVPIEVLAGEVAKTRIFVEGVDAWLMSVAVEPALGDIEIGDDGWVWYYADLEAGDDEFTVVVDGDGASVEVPVSVAVAEAGGCSSSPVRSAWWLVAPLALVARRRQST